MFLEGLRQTRPEVCQLVTATRGNHGQSPPYAARDTGIAVTVCVPQLFRAMADLDTVHVPTGMRSGFCGLIRTRNQLGLETRKARNHDPLSS